MCACTCVHVMTIVRAFDFFFNLCMSFPKFYLAKSSYFWSLQVVRFPVKDPSVRLRKSLLSSWLSFFFTLLRTESAHRPSFLWFYVKFHLSLTYSMHNQPPPSVCTEHRNFPFCLSPPPFRPPFFPPGKTAIRNWNCFFLLPPLLSLLLLALSFAEERGKKKKKKTQWSEKGEKDKERKPHKDR